jgi:hypothetical protein
VTSATETKLKNAAMSNVSSSVTGPGDDLLLPHPATVLQGDVGFGTPNSAARSRAA